MEVNADTRQASRCNIDSMCSRSSGSSSMTKACIRDCELWLAAIRGTGEHAPSECKTSRSSIVSTHFALVLHPHPDARPCTHVLPGLAGVEHQWYGLENQSSLRQKQHEFIELYSSSRTGIEFKGRATSTSRLSE